MTKIDPKDIALIKSIYEQHWLHARHVELERLSLTSIFAAILAGAFTLLKDKLFEPSSLPILAVLMLFSILGMVFSMKMASIFKAHTNAAKRILIDLYGHDLTNFLWAKFDSNRINSWIRISGLFPIFYLVCFIFLLDISVWIVFGSYKLVGILTGIFILFGAFIYRIKYNNDLLGPI